MKQTRVSQLALLVLALNASATVHHVDLNSTNSVPPYTNWSTAATNIQDAIDVSTNGDTVLVTNGVYATGGQMTAYGGTNRITVTNAITVRSVNGPAVTVIQGNNDSGTNATRCALLMSSNALLSGFTLTNGQAPPPNPGTARPAGGGVQCSSSAVVSNCVLVGNSSSYRGGGAYNGRLVNCVLKNNSARFGGGARGSTLINCLIVSNTASTGGGAYLGNLTNCTIIGNSATNFAGGITLDGGPASMNNCIVFYNTASSGANYYDPNGIGMNYCDTTPLDSGVGNITDEPAFVSLAAGDFHLQSNSPCINAGNNAYVTNSTDLDGHPRIVSGTVDIGAYEFQTPVSIISYAWLYQYGLPITTNTDSSDPDGDGMNNWQEWQAGTIPTNAASLLQMQFPSNNLSGLTVSWQSVSGKTYFLQRSSNFGAQPAFSALKSNIIGQAGTTVYTDASATNSGPYFYRVGVQ